MASEVVENGRLDLERRKLDFEREKWEAKVAHQQRLAAREDAEHQLRAADFDLRREEHRRAGWRNPLVVAILAATIAAVGNGVVTVVNGSLQRAIESQRSDSVRILEMIRTAGDSDKAAENLKFLLEAGLVDNPSRIEKLKAFLEKREPGTGPSLLGGRVVPGIVGPDDAVSTDALQAGHPLRRIANAVGLLLSVRKDGFSSACTSFLIGDGLLLTAFHCVEDVSSLTVELSDDAGTERYPIPPQPVAADRDLDFAVFRVPEEAASRFGAIRLGDSVPHLGQQIAAVYYRGGGRRLAVLSDDCRIVKVEARKIHHLCDTGAGSAGALIVSSDGTLTIGLHHRRGPLGGVATRIDTIKQAISRITPGY